MRADVENGAGKGPPSFSPMFQSLDHDPIQLNRIMVQFFAWSTIFSENRFPPSDQVRGQAFSGSCSKKPSLHPVLRAGTGESGMAVLMTGNLAGIALPGGSLPGGSLVGLWSDGPS